MAELPEGVRRLNVLEDVTVLDARNQRMSPPLRRIAVGVAVENPYAGAFSDDLTQLIDLGDALGVALANIAVQRLGGTSTLHSVGKAAIVGLNGEIEHAAAVLHPRFGKSFRTVLGECKAITPSSKKIGVAGTAIDVPLHYKDAAYVRSHFDALEFRMADAPRPNELVVVLVVTDGGRPSPRVGGLALDEVEGKDGLR